MHFMDALRDLTTLTHGMVDGMCKGKDDVESGEAEQPVMRFSDLARQEMEAEDPVEGSTGPIVKGGTKGSAATLTTAGTTTSSTSTTSSTTPSSHTLTTVTIES